MFSPSAIADFLACRHLTALNRLSDAKEIQKPHFDDPGLKLLSRLGEAHEQQYLSSLKDEGLKVVAVPTDGLREEAAARTVEAIRSGMDVVYQPAFLVRGLSGEGAGEDACGPRTEGLGESVGVGGDGVGEESFGNGEAERRSNDKLKFVGHSGWYGRADFLRRVERPSELGAFSYEVIETKLARSTKARAIIQLCFYSDLLARIQGVVPEYMHVVLGGGAKPEQFLVQSYLAFFRKIKADFVAAQQAQLETYPEPVEHCRICDWSTVCEAQWRKDDHLSLVANITRNQRQALIEYGTQTVSELVRMTVPPVPKVEGIKDPAFANIHQQARLQVHGREEKRNIYELLVPRELDKGLCSLPLPSIGDVFLDFEGDKFTFEGGLEYLFGVLTVKRKDAEEAQSSGELIYEPLWALNPAEEKQAFEKFIRMVMERRQQYPDMHVYHYGSYEETAIKRMSNQHSICVDEVDELLRGDVLVDMLRAVRQGLRASVESYSIKKLEPFYKYERAVDLPDANRALWTFQTILAFGPGDLDLGQLKGVIEGYNRDDCVSALLLRNWLEQLRKELEERTGEALPRPLPKQEAPSENLTEYLKTAHAVEERLTADLPDDKETWTAPQKATGLLADLIEWHRREDKSKYWEYYNRLDYSDEEFITDRSTLGGMVHLGEVDKVKNSLVHRYRFPFQDTTIERAKNIRDPKTKKAPGYFHAIDYEALTIDIKRGPKLANLPHPTALVPYDIIGNSVMRDSLLRIGSSVAEQSIGGDGPYKVARELLLRNVPRLSQGVLADFENLPSLEAAKRIGLLLDNTVLPIQGPPGSGKTFTGSHMILELVEKGKTVGVSAVSHKVISNLLETICKEATKLQRRLSILQKCDDDDDDCDHDFVETTKDNKLVDRAVAEKAKEIIAGTVWLWSRPEMANSVDVLFVDEAGQMSLANVLAASPAANSIVLLGDPQQLDQPQRGVHPARADASALSHLLNGHETIEPGHGLFLAESWRLHPDICAFTSEVFYEDRLTSRPENANQRLNVEGRLGGTGLRFVPVEHKGNQSDSREEVERVFELVESLLSCGTTWTDKEANVARMEIDDILIVAPYNAQVSMLLRRLPRGSRVGTVDKFQGQEAPVVIYSMATSTPEDAPRGMEFLYSLNRLNVATSRAQCVTILVASPALFDVSCKTPRQMELSNAFCLYLEMAEVI